MCHDPLSCADPLADRRFAYGRAAADAGDWPTAVDLYEQAGELAPRWAPAQFALGEARERLGDADGAVRAWRACLALDPEDRQGAAARLALLEGATPQQLSPGYVARLFDDYAPRFEDHLAGTLGYRGPELLICALDEASPRRRFEAVLDIGCGTG